ncbi:MAG: carboxymuconolactone decarboxylase family protein [Burkholderiales bacterium]
MAHIQPLPPEEIRDPELLEVIRRGAALGVPDALFPRVMARVPVYAKALLRALIVSHSEGSVDHRLKEIIRLQLARTAGDPYFAGLRSARAMAAGLDEDRIAAGAGRFEDDARFSPAEKWALRYAREMYLNPERIDAAFYAEGKQHYTEAEIMELGAFIAFHYGMQAFTRTLGLSR